MSFAGRGGGGTPAPSGGGGGGGVRITGGGGGATARPQKTQVLNHAEQSAIGGPGARPVGGMGPGPGGGVHPNIGEHGRPGGDMHPSQRDERANPDRFRNFDSRFDRDRDRLGNTFWRTAFSDYDFDRFGPWLEEDPWLYQIFGVQYYPELLQYAIPFYPTQCGPWGEGIWTIGADSRWWPVHRHQLDIIRRVEAVRAIGRYEPVIIPNCGIGGGIAPYPAAPVPTLYPAPRVSYPYLI